MKLSEFKFDLPEGLIAQEPARQRDESRLMVLHKKTGEIEHRIFKEVINYFEPVLSSKEQGKPIRKVGDKYGTF